jgi:2'-5' RNA ligase superfamily
MPTANSDIFQNPSYIVLNIPSPVAEELRNIRAFLDPPRANMAVEISLCGSNGRGTIFPGQDPDLVFAEIDAIARQTEAFRAKFGHVEHFPDTGIFYYTLKDPEPFEKLHSMFVESSIKFAPTDFSYEPHCTLKLSQHAEYTEKQILKHLRPPKHNFIIDTMSIYSLSQNQQIPRLLHRVNLG